MNAAWALSSWAWAVMTSDLAAVPALYWFCVIVTERLYLRSFWRAGFPASSLSEGHIGEREGRLLGE